MDVLRFWEILDPQTAQDPNVELRSVIGVVPYNGANRSSNIHPFLQKDPIIAESEGLGEGGLLENNITCIKSL